MKKYQIKIKKINPIKEIENQIGIKIVGILKTPNETIIDIESEAFPTPEIIEKIKEMLEKKKIEINEVQKHCHILTR